MFAIFLTSGLFLGWSLGANDAANVFGTAVGTRMISFKKAAILSGIFVILGAVISGAGAARTLGELGAVNAIAGAFVGGQFLALFQRDRHAVIHQQPVLGQEAGEQHAMPVLIGDFLHQVRHGLLATTV